ncbi:hypothetical protein [Phenylobacterium aquaticum]|nr:hypothetical protein [Phenylobacterium aquaticum]
MRISVVGSSGSGKSTLARRLAAVLDIPHVELDAINWQPGWVDLNNTDPDEFLRRTYAALDGAAWVTDGNYSKVAAATRARATDLIWLDYPKALIMSRVIRRSLVRAIGGQELWPGTGNTESFARWLDKEHPIRWSWDTYARIKTRYAAMSVDGTWDHLRIHRLTHPREADALVARLAAEAH